MKHCLMVVVVLISALVGHGCESGPVAGDVDWEYLGGDRDVTPVPRIRLSYDDGNRAATKLQSGCIRWDWKIEVDAYEQDVSVYSKKTWLDGEDGELMLATVDVRVPPSPRTAVPEDIRRAVSEPRRTKASLSEYPVEIDFQVVTQAGDHWRSRDDADFILQGRFGQPPQVSERFMFLCESELELLLSYPVSSYQILIRPSIRGELFPVKSLARRLQRSTISEALTED
ncbi:MAG: hypothetical protein CMJ34_01930 [Phycisphaerae bacterium]|nr:hypothetical protein [Phycisphaerae bacterium]